MANINDFFGDNKWLKASDLQGREVKVTIDGWTKQQYDEGTKPAIHFVGKEKGLVLNRTNANKISDAYGPDPDMWDGKQIIIYPDRTDFKGQMVDCIRVRIPLDNPMDDFDPGF